MLEPSIESKIQENYDNMSEYLNLKPYNNKFIDLYVYMIFT